MPLNKNEIEYVTEILIKEKEMLEDYLSAYNDKCARKELLTIKNILDKGVK